MDQDRYDWPRMRGLAMEWLVIAVVAGIGLLALLDPDSIEVLFSAEL
jgi:hypothetical protein